MARIESPFLKPSRAAVRGLLQICHGDAVGGNVDLQFVGDGRARC